MLFLGPRSVLIYMFSGAYPSHDDLLRDDGSLLFHSPTSAFYYSKRKS